MAGNALTKDLNKLLTAGFSAEPALEKALGEWLQWLCVEKRAANNTVKSYARDIQGFLRFLTEHLGFRPGIKDM